MSSRQSPTHGCSEEDMLPHRVGSQACCIQDVQHSEHYSLPNLLAGFLSKKQKQEFQDCFALLDTDKTGRLSVDNLLGAFQLLNIEVQQYHLKSALYSHVQNTTVPAQPLFRWSTAFTQSTALQTHISWHQTHIKCSLHYLHKMANSARLALQG